MSAPVLTDLTRPRARLIRAYLRLIPMVMRRAPWVPRILRRVPPRWRVRRVALAYGTWGNALSFAATDMEVHRLTYSPDVVLEVPVEHLGALGFEERYVGIAGLDRFMHEWAETWSEQALHPVSIEDHGHLAVMRYVLAGRGAGSGAQTEMPAAMVCWYGADDLRVVRVCVCAEADAEAVARAG